MLYARHSNAGPARWGVTCTCREPTQLLAAFAAHYIALGAEEVHLYLDAPQPDLEHLLAPLPQVFLTVCDNGYWQSQRNKDRPKTIEHRQLLNAFDAYHRTQMDWLAHFDADEFLHVDMPLGDLLSAMPEEVSYAFVEPRERAYVEGAQGETIFDGVFRRPTLPQWGDTSFLYSRAGRFARQGVLGYPHGKSIMRTGLSIKPGIHSPRPLGASADIELKRLPLLRGRLLHFDGLTPFHWLGKLLRAAAADSPAHLEARNTRNAHRVRQIIRMQRKGGDLRTAYDMHNRLRVIPGDQAERLRALGLIEDYRIEPARDLAALGINRAIDLGADAFDRALAAQMPQVEGWLAEWQALNFGASAVTKAG